MKKHLFFPVLTFFLLPFLVCGQTLQDQLNSAQPGDTIEFSGTHLGNFATKVSGTAAKPIIIRGVGTDAVIDGGTTTTGYGLTLKHDYYRLENFTIRNCKKGLFIENGHHGIAKGIHMENIGQEALKVKRTSSYWLFENCSTKNTGLSGDYGEGFYVGDADSNWEVSTKPDTPRYITFLNCTATDPINDGFDIKEGAQFVKLVNCSVNWVNVVPLSGHGNSGYYSRGNDIQYINCSSEGNSSGGPAFKHFQVDATDGVRYGYRIELKGAVVKDHAGSAFHFHRNDIAQSSFLYDDYSLVNVAGPLWGSTAQAPIVAASEFTEMVWSGEGGEVYSSSDPVAATGVEVSPSSLSLAVGQTGSLSAAVLPSNATNKEVTWSSSNTAVATVNTSGIVSAIAEGTAVITAITSDGGFTDYSNVTVSSTSQEIACDFGTPSASALPSITQNYSYAHVIGTGPSMSNFKEFSIKWNAKSNGLHKFAINTTDGIPDFYVDLRVYTTHNFGSSQPGFTLSGSGIDGLDGEYWIAIHDGNIVWEEKGGNYIIYYSNSATPPSCTLAASTSSSQKTQIPNSSLISDDLTLYPNPAKEGFAIQYNELQRGDVIEVYSLTGKLILRETVESAQTQWVNLQHVKPGMYLVKISSAGTRFLRVVKQ